MSADLLAGIIAFLVTVMILSYVVGDNPAFRVAVSVFVGATAGYVAAVAWWQVLLPRLLIPLLAGPAPSRTLLAVPFLLSGLLLMKVWPPLSRLGSPPLGLLVGVASAVAIGGAIQGTLMPQLSATVNAVAPPQLGSIEGLIYGGFILLGLISSLIYFQFFARLRKDGSIGRPRLVEFAAGIGGVMIAVALGVMFAGVFSAALVALIERLHFIVTLLGAG